MTRPPALRCAAALAGMLLACAPARAALPDVLVEAVTVEGAEVRVRLSGPAAGTSVDASGGEVRVTIRGARLGARLERGAAGGAVRGFHVEAVRGGVAVVLDVAPGTEVEARRGASDVTISLVAPRRSAGWGGMRAPAAVPAEPAAERRPSRRRPPARPAAEAPRPVDPVAAPVASSDAGVAARAPSRRTPTRRAPERQAPERPAAVPAAIPTAAPPAADAGRWSLDTIVLDAGHGGRDFGASYDGVHEKDITLGVTRRLGGMLERELGVRVVYTRTDDRFVELRERGRIANRAGGKLFVSVHANAATNRSAYGTETFFLAPHRSADAREVMERENGVIQFESAPELYDRFLNQGDILEQMAMSAYQEESQALAGLVEGEFVGQGLRSRGVKQAGFLVLWAASMPAVLVELGFVSNRDEARRLASERGQEDAARAIFRGIAAHKARYERGLRVASGTW